MPLAPLVTATMPQRGPFQGNRAEPGGVEVAPTYLREAEFSVVSPQRGVALDAVQAKHPHIGLMRLPLGPPQKLLSKPLNCVLSADHQPVDVSRRLVLVLPYRLVGPQQAKGSDDLAASAADHMALSCSDLALHIGEGDFVMPPLLDTQALQPVRQDQTQCQDGLRVGLGSGLNVDAHERRILLAERLRTAPAAVVTPLLLQRPAHRR